MKTAKFLRAIATLGANWEAGDIIDYVQQLAVISVSLLVGLTIGIWIGHATGIWIGLAFGCCSYAITMGVGAKLFSW